MVANNQALCKTCVFLKDKGHYMNRTSKMEGSLLRKNATKKKNKLSGKMVINKNKL